VFLRGDGGRDGDEGGVGALAAVAAANALDTDVDLVGRQPECGGDPHLHLRGILRR
jgi:hypothetical protein